MQRLTIFRGEGHVTMWPSSEPSSTRLRHAPGPDPLVVRKRLAEYAGLGPWRGSGRRFGGPMVGGVLVGWQATRWAPLTGRGLAREPPRKRTHTGGHSSCGVAWWAARRRSTLRSLSACASLGPILRSCSSGGLARAASAYRMPMFDIAAFNWRAGATFCSILVATPPRSLALALMVRCLSSVALWGPHSVRVANAGTSSQSRDRKRRVGKECKQSG